MRLKEPLPITHVEHSVNGAAVLAEGGWVDEERRYEVDGVRAGQLANELSSPAFSDRLLPKCAAFARESGREDAAVVLKLVRVVGVRSDVRAEGRGVRRRRTWEGPGVSNVSSIVFMKLVRRDMRDRRVRTPCRTR